jgi:hypothetical protein
MTETTRQTKITLGEMRASGARGLLIYCSTIIAVMGQPSTATAGRMKSGCPI